MRKSKSTPSKKAPRPCKVVTTTRQRDLRIISYQDGRVEIIRRPQPDLEDRQELLRD